MRRAIVILGCLYLSGCDTAASADQGRNHRIQPGESLFSIAAEAYGNGLEWPRIWEANPWIDPDRLQAGDLLYVPPMDDSWGDPKPPPQAQFSNRSSNPFGSAISFWAPASTNSSRPRNPHNAPTGYISAPQAVHMSVPVSPR